MRFHIPVVLSALALVPLTIAIYLLWLRRKRRALAAFANPSMLPAIAPVAPGWRRHVVPALVLSSVTVLVLAAARPEARATVPRERATVMLAIDASRSMLATDIAPTRLAAAKAAIGRFLHEMPERYRVGAVAFSGTARVLSPPTDDRDALAESIVALRPARGTVVGDALIDSIRTLRADWATGGRAPAVVLLLSDGNDTGSEVPPAQAAVAAERLGVSVSTIALGDPTTRVDGKPRPPDVGTLRAIANVAEGRFYPAATGRDLAEVWDRLGSRIATTVEYRELTFAFVAAALLIAAVAAAIGTRLFRRLP